MFSNLKGWARGVYHGPRRKYLQTYLDEFDFRFNRRRTRHAAFRSLFAIAARAKPITYSMLTSPELVHKQPSSIKRALATGLLLRIDWSKETTPYPFNVNNSG